MTDKKPVTISLVPEGAKTPEGVARINKAQDALETANARCVSALRELMHAIAFASSLADLGDIADEDGEAAKALERQSEAQEEFLRAVAGAPPMPPRA